MIHRPFFPLLLFPAFFCAAQETLVLDYSFGNFHNAQRISMDQMGRVFVADMGANLVVRSPIDGSETKSVGGLGWDQDQFDRPMGLDARFGLEVYVADYGNHRIQRFDGNLNYVGSLSTRDNPDPAARFGYPLDVAMSRLGDLYLVDSENTRILRVTSFSTVERAFGSIESGEGQLRDPRRIAIGPDDLVYVLEPHRVAVFDLFGSYVRQIPVGGDSPASGFCVDGQHLYIVTHNECLIHNLQGGMPRHFRKSDMAGLTDPGEFRDVAVTRDALILLASDTAHLFHAVR